MWLGFQRNHFLFFPFPRAKAQTDKYPTSSQCEAVLFLVDPRKLPVALVWYKHPWSALPRGLYLSGLLIVCQSQVRVIRIGRGHRLMFHFWVTNSDSPCLDLKLRFYSDLWGHFLLSSQVCHAFFFLKGFYILPRIFRCSVYLTILLKTQVSLGSLSCTFFQDCTLVYVSCYSRRLVVVRNKAMGERKL